MIAMKVAATPPWDAITPHTPQVAVTTVTGALVAVTLVYTLAMWRRRGTPFYLLILLGGLLCILNEPALDLVSQIYFPRREAWTVFEAYGRPMPAWGVLSYTVFFGTQTIAAVELLRRGASRARFWLVVVGVWVLNSCLEVTMLNTRIYFYFGDQPLRIGQFPAVWLVLNVIGVVTAAALFLRFRSFFTGPRTLLAMLVPPICQVVGLWFGTPHFLLLNSDQSHTAKVIASLVSIVAGLVALDFVGRIACQGQRDAALDDHSHATATAGDHPAKV